MKIYCDLDGVLCDFDKNFENIANMKSEDFEKKYGPRPFWKKIEEYGVEWWSDMSWTEDGKELWYFLTENFDNIEILTGSPWGKVGEYAKQGKDEWCYRELGQYKVNHKLGRVKYELCEQGDILIDDTKKVIDNWIEKGNGIGILHKNAIDTIKKIEHYL